MRQSRTNDHGIISIFLLPVALSFLMRVLNYISVKKIRMKWISFGWAAEAAIKMIHP